jgi:hypothetical protein
MKAAARNEVCVSTSGTATLIANQRERSMRKTRTRARVQLSHTGRGGCTESSSSLKRSGERAASYVPTVKLSVAKRLHFICAIGRVAP